MENLLIQPLGTVVTYHPPGGEVLKTPGVLLVDPFRLEFAGFRDDPTSPVLNPAPGQPQTALAYALASAYYRCGTPTGAPAILGAGECRYTHMAGLLDRKTPGDNHLRVSVVDIGDGLDFGDNLRPGQVVGLSPSWPAGPAGTKIAFPLDFGGMEVPGSFILRVDSAMGLANHRVGDDGAPILDAWTTNISALTISAEVSAAAMSEEDQMIAKLAAANDISEELLRQVLKSLRGSR